MSGGSDVATWMQSEHGREPLEAHVVMWTQFEPEREPPELGAVDTASSRLGGETLLHLAQCRNRGLEFGGLGWRLGPQGIAAQCWRTRCRCTFQKGSRLDGRETAEVVDMDSEDADVTEEDKDVSPLWTGGSNVEGLETAVGSSSSSSRNRGSLGSEDGDVDSRTWRRRKDGLAILIQLRPSCLKPGDSPSTNREPSALSPSFLATFSSRAKTTGFMRWPRSGLGPGPSRTSIRLFGGAERPGKSVSSSESGTGFASRLFATSRRAFSHVTGFIPIQYDPVITLLLGVVGLVSVKVMRGIELGRADRRLGAMQGHDSPNVKAKKRRERGMKNENSKDFEAGEQLHEEDKGRTKSVEGDGQAQYHTLTRTKSIEGDG
ncbi:hypothetical protein C8R45DRAFT_923975 [Mycena sanguinolenta]|nr:hypothetical protein C8R45DRAFT_923975 [Mycena sanguinolenta]